MSHAARTLTTPSHRDNGCGLKAASCTVAAAQMEGARALAASPTSTTTPSPGVGEVGGRARTGKRGAQKILAKAPLMVTTISLYASRSKPGLIMARASCRVRWVGMKAGRR